MIRQLACLGIVVLGCSDGSGEDGGSSESSGSDGGSVELSDPMQEGVEPTGIESAADMGRAVDRDCGADHAYAWLLPVSGDVICIKADAACEEEGAGCPLYIADNVSIMGQAAAKRIVVNVESRNSRVDRWAEMPRVIKGLYPGLDEARIFAMGWSLGSHKMELGVCHASDSEEKHCDKSPIGTVSDLYAGTAGLGGCGCATDYPQLAGNHHVILWNGADDIFAKDGCYEKLQQRAKVNGCSKLDPGWQAVEPDDPYAKNADGSDNALVAHFGACERGEVVAYRFKDEEHVLSAKKHFDPKISAVDTAIRFFEAHEK